MEFPKSVLDIANEAAAKHGDDIQKAVAVAEKEIRSLPEFDELVSTLVTSAVQDLIYESRHKMNVRLKNQAGSYSKPAKVVSGASKAVQSAYESYYQFRIAGMMLGSILGEQLDGIAQQEESIAKGHHFNARLCRRLQQVVPEGKRVQDALSERKLRSIFEEVRSGADKPVVRIADVKPEKGKPITQRAAARTIAAE